MMHNRVFLSRFDALGEITWMNLCKCWVVYLIPHSINHPSSQSYFFGNLEPMRFTNTEFDCCGFLFFSSISFLFRILSVITNLLVDLEKGEVFP